MTSALLSGFQWADIGCRPLSDLINSDSMLNSSAPFNPSSNRFLLLQADTWPRPLRVILTHLSRLRARSEVRDLLSSLHRRSNGPHASKSRHLMPKIPSAYVHQLLQLHHGRCCQGVPVLSDTPHHFDEQSILGLYTDLILCSPVDHRGAVCVTSPKMAANVA